MAPHKVFVCAATGTQGGAVARQLRAIGWEVNTTTRDPNSPAAQALTSIGVKVHQGGWDETAALESALAGCDLLFLNLMPDLTNLPSEAEFGTNLVRLARAAGVAHVVYSSGLAMPERESHPFSKMAFAAKGTIEKAVQEAGFRHWTILRPGFFMANFLVPKVNMMYAGAAETGLFTLAFHPDSKLPMIDHEDIGAFAVAALQSPERFHQQVIDLIGEVVATEEAMETMRRVTGRNIRAKYLTDEELAVAKVANPMLALQEVLRSADMAVNAAGAKTWGIQLGTFERFVEREKKAFEETYQTVSN